MLFHILYFYRYSNTTPGGGGAFKGSLGGGVPPRLSNPDPV